MDNEIGQRIGTMIDGLLSIVEQSMDARGCDDDPASPVAWNWRHVVDRAGRQAAATAASLINASNARRVQARRSWYYTDADVVRGVREGMDTVEDEKAAAAEIELLETVVKYSRATVLDDEQSVIRDQLGVLGSVLRLDDDGWAVAIHGADLERAILQLKAGE